MATKEARIAAYQAVVEDEFTVKDIMGVNHQPHPYTIGAKHVAAAAGRGGVLSEDICDEMTCAVPGCDLTAKDHTCDMACFLQQRKSMRQSVAKASLQRIVDIVAERGETVDGFTFVETPEKFRFMKELEGVKVGDTIVRLMSNQELELELVVTEVEDTQVICGSWVFDIATGAEIDEGLDWGPPPDYDHTGSVAQVKDDEQPELDYVITCEPVCDKEELSADDQDCFDIINGEHRLKGVNTKAVLDIFHNTVPIKVLDDWTITCEVAES